MTSRSIKNFLVYIPEDECYGIVKSYGAFASLVSYTHMGIDYEVFILNEDLIFLDDFSISIEEEEI